MLDDLIKKLQNADPLLSEEKAAPILGIRPHTLSVWRCKKKNGEPAPDLPWVRIGRRSIRYRLSDLLKFIELNRQTSGEADQ